MIMSVDGDGNFGRTDDQSSDGFDVESGGKILYIYTSCRVAGLGRLSAGAKMAMKPFVKHVFTIFTTNKSFLRVISNFRI